FSMCLHWWKHRGLDPRWRFGLAVNGLGLALTSLILVATTIMKFSHGGWVTLLITSVFVALCLAVKAHYEHTNQALKRLDDMLVGMDLSGEAPEMGAPEAEGPTAVLLVNGYSGLGIHAIFSMRKLFNKRGFTNVLFVQAGRIDSSKF